MEVGLSMVPRVDAFLLGAPKSGTTWLAEALTQHPGICVSEPKEPNMVATHKGTFPRDDSKPDWSAYSTCFATDGVRIDCSVHALACPLAPHRVAENWPTARFVICLREPVSRTISHWNMILDTGEDVENGSDWSDFAQAWSDPRLQCDTLYGAAISRWLEYFERDSFLLIEANRMRREPELVLAEVCSHLKLAAHTFDIDSVHNANVAADRRSITIFGRIFRFTASLLPGFIKRPIVMRLQGRGVNVYKMPVLSREAPAKREIGDAQRGLLVEEVNADLNLLEDLTGFNVDHWRIHS